jgi:hypothetical protein
MFQDLPPQTTTATTTGIEFKCSAMPADALLGNNPPSFAEREEAILSPQATDRVNCNIRTAWHQILDDD